MVSYLSTIVDIDYIISLLTSPKSCSLKIYRIPRSLRQNMVNTFFVNNYYLCFIVTISKTCVHNNIIYFIKDTYWEEALRYSSSLFSYSSIFFTNIQIFIFIE